MLLAPAPGYGILPPISIGLAFIMGMEVLFIGLPCTISIARGEEWELPGLELLLLLNPPAAAGL